MALSAALFFQWRVGKGPGSRNSAEFLVSPGSPAILSAQRRVLLAMKLILVGRELRGLGREGEMDIEKGSLC
jgi:hypothetical protein